MLLTLLLWMLGGAAAWETVVQVGHELAVTGVVFSDDGHHVLSLSGDSWRLWDARTWQLVRGGNEPLGVVAGSQEMFDPRSDEYLNPFTGARRPSGDVGRVAVAGAHRVETSHRQITWSALDEPFTTEEDITAIALDHTGERLAVALKDKTVWVYGGRKPRSFTTLRPVRSMVWAGGTVWTLGLQRVSRDDGSREAPVVDKGIKSIAAHPNGSQLLTASGTVALRDAETYEPIWERPTQDGAVYVTFDRTGERFAWASPSGLIGINDTGQGQRLATVGTAAAGSSEWDWVFDQGVLWTFVDKQLWGLDLATTQLRTGRRLVDGVHWIPESFRSGRKLGVTRATREGVTQLTVYDLESAREVRQVEGSWPVALSHDGRLLATNATGVRGAQQSTYVYDLDSGTRVHEVQGFGSLGLELDFAQDDSALVIMALGSDQKPGDRIQVLDLRSGEVRWKAPAPVANEKGFLKEAQTTPDGHVVTLSSEGRLHRWSLGGGGPELLERQVGTGGNDNAFSDDGRWFAQIGGEISFVHDLAGQGKATTLVASRMTRTRSVAFERDASLVFTGSFDGSGVVWDPRTGEELVQVLPDGSRGFLLLTPDGHYTASSASVRGIAFRQGDRAYPFQQFDAVRNRPDKVLGRLGLASPEVVEQLSRRWQHRIDKLEVDVEAFERAESLPVVEVSDVPAMTDAASVALQVSVASAASELSRLLVYVNGVPIHGREGLALTGLSATLPVEVPLGRGPNAIELSAVDEAGLESVRERRHVVRSGDTAGKLFAVLVGVSDYAQSDFDLRFAAKDARDLAERLARSPSHSEVQTQVITDGEATAASIRSARALLEQATVDDTVLVFLAGHGLRDDEDAYWFATHDVDFESPRNAGLAFTDLEQIFDGLQARKRILMLDTCFSGEIEPDVTVVAAVDGEAGSVSGRTFRGLGVARKLQRTALSHELGELFLDLRRGTGTVVLTSASGMELAFEDSGVGNGLFTHALLQVLEANPRGVDVSFVSGAVRRKVEDLTTGVQRPTVRNTNLEQDFRLY